MWFIHSIHIKKCIENNQCLLYLWNFFIEEAINDLVALGKPVYVSVVLFPDTLCIEIMSSPESNSYDKAIEQMETFLTDNKITGIILENLSLFVSHLSTNNSLTKSAKTEIFPIFLMKLLIDNVLW